MPIIYSVLCFTFHISHFTYVICSMYLSAAKSTLSRQNGNKIGDLKTNNHTHHSSILCGYSTWFSETFFVCFNPFHISYTIQYIIMCGLCDRAQVLRCTQFSMIIFHNKIFHLHSHCLGLLSFVCDLFLEAFLFFVRIFFFFYFFFLFCTQFR